MNSQDVLNIIDPKHALFGLFFAFSNRLQAAGDGFYEEITTKQFFLMACMNLFGDEPPTANDLAKVMGCTRQNVKEILTGLEKKGLIAFEPHKTDKRKRMVVVTQKAIEVSQKYAAKEDEFIWRLYEGVSDEEIVNTYLFLAKLEDNLKKITGEVK
ncbi:MAG: MarR family transcriptional regulator [Clostridia bacterium]|nr:MarR family transcriptional regulator [Clostridia bacterium]